MSRHRADPFVAIGGALERGVAGPRLLQPPGDEAGQRRPGEQHDQKAQGL
jgi:hypothetical protein